jgi:hypothetical protein
MADWLCNGTLVTQKIAWIEHGTQGLPCCTYWTRNHSVACGHRCLCFIAVCNSDGKLNEHRFMEKIVRRTFQPILRIFESGDGEYRYEKSHRKILIAMGVLFLALSTVSAVLAVISSQLGGLIPFLVFFMIGLVCEVVGLLGSNRAVAKIWGSK